MLILKGAALIRERRLFGARHLLEEIWYSKMALRRLETIMPSLQRQESRLQVYTVKSQLL